MIIQLTINEDDNSINNNSKRKRRQILWMKSFLKR